MEIFCTAEQATDDNIIACGTAEARHTLGIYDAYCFTTTTVVTRRRLNVTFIVHCLSCVSFNVSKLGVGRDSVSQYSDSLRAGRSGDRIPVGARFSAPVQTGPGGPPSLVYNGYRVSFPGVKRPGRGVDHPRASSAEVKERVKLYLYSSSRPSWPVLG